MNPSKQFVVLYDPSSRKARFVVRFAAPAESDAVDCAEVIVETGDGTTLRPGVLCTPSVLEWRTRDEQQIGTHTYKGKGPFVAAMTWGSERHDAPVGKAKPAPMSSTAAPILTLFDVRPDPADPYGVAIKVKAEGLARDHQLRVDTGAGQVFVLDAGIAATESSFAALYHKMGSYTVAVDVIDGNGFRVGALGESTIEITEQEQALHVGPLTSAARESAEVRSDVNVPLRAAATVPWLPFRYARPNFSGVRAYKTPGGAVTRSLTTWTFVAIRREVASGGEIWYETGLYDWVQASKVHVVAPSDLRGVAFDGGELPTQPTEPTTPTTPTTPTGPTTDERQATVIAGVLNVRARPGVTYDNPPIGTLRYGATVTIYEEAMVAGTRWYRIGTNRWVHAGYVRLNTAADVMPPAPRSVEPVGVPAPPLLVPPMTTPLMPPAAAPRYDMPFGWVVAPTLAVRKAPGDAAEAIGELSHYQVVPILEETKVGGRAWYRIGNGQWATSEWIGVARQKPRPASIGPTTKWVGVSLKEQVAIAYEGDKPVYAGLAATGTGGSPTVQGIFKTWWRVTSRKMSGPGYFLEEVTWTEYFFGGYSLHTAYWHDAFGRPRSHGCVNLTPYDAWWIFQWSAPGGANAPTVYTYWA